MSALSYLLRSMFVTIVRKYWTDIVICAVLAVALGLSIRATVKVNRLDKQVQNLTEEIGSSLNVLNTSVITLSGEVTKLSENLSTWMYAYQAAADGEKVIIHNNSIVTTKKPVNKTK